MGVVDVVTDGPLLLAAPVAAAAGLLSFLSPCVLPLVPGYLSFITGLSGEELQRPSAPAAARGPAESAAGSAAPVPASLAAAEPASAGLVAAGVGSASAGPAVGGSAGSGSAGSGSAGSAAPAGSPASTAGAAASWARRLGSVRRAGRVTAGTCLFILGFTIVFVTYGAAFGGLGRWLRVHQVGLSQVLGAVTILMGLGFAGVFSRMSWANREWRFHRLPSPGLLGAPALGVLFGLGWTPCIGPTLAAVLGMAAQSATAGRGAFLSAMYCLGLGLPFLVVGLAFHRVAGALRVVRHHARLLALTGGALLVAVGVLQLTGGWADLVDQLRPYAPGFSESPL